jgi:DNA-binding response OmpR family regulator
MSWRILIAEDDPKSRALLVKFLEAKGHEVIPAADGQEALEKYVEAQPDLVLLDVMMPKVDGWGVLKEVRAQGEIPVILVTVKDATEDKVHGLSLGADDYITKPFDLREVEARIEAVMRRVQTSPPSRIEAGPITIDDETKEVTVHGKRVELSPKEYELLRFLASKPGRVFSHEEILRSVWAESPYAGAEDVKKYIYLLRNKIERNPEGPELIVTVRGFGYKLNA